MAFRLDLQQDLSDSVRACMGGELDAAIESLSVADPAQRPTAVHDARKRIKKARSALRLVHSGLDKRTVRHLNDDLRAIDLLQLLRLLPHWRRLSSAAGHRTIRQRTAGSYSYRLFHLDMVA